MTKTSDITQAVNLLREGGLVAFPTETVYGLGADAANESAIRKVFRAKERPFDHPLIVHLASMAQLETWARDISPAAIKLAEQFWPGPLTLLLKKQPQVLDLVTGGQATVGLRIPQHPVAQALLQAFGGGIVAPSANRFTHISPTTAAAVYEELNGRVDLILEGGACEVGLESTIVDMSGDEPVILRPGMITAPTIAAALGLRTVASRQNTAEIRVPGMHHLHYAPITKTVLIETDHISDWLQAAKAEALPTALVTHSLMPFPQTAQVHRVQMPSDAVAYAHALYHTLRTLDHQHLKRIVIECVPEDSEWDAIRDRLHRAATPREL